MKPPQAQRSRVGPSVSAPGWRATPVILNSRPQLSAAAVALEGLHSPPLAGSLPFLRRNAGTSRSKRLPPEAALAFGVLR